ncbi:uncharacterized protein LOC129285823 isoform X1 [Prosopis cineraria]|uniref:uncharacterized protein LOC129285823 isoform X1 n=1 Tax=Prosopis cineraria TaxID=364024 RepID=UPI0024100B45|nr:uncharacterized protein LOC129285823 isoform X1 [Prosopis cineraria]
MQEITIIHVLHTSLWQRICMAWSGGSSIYIWMSLRKIELATQEADQKRREKLVSQFFEMQVICAVSMSILSSRLEQVPKFCYLSVKIDFTMAHVHLVISNFFPAPSLVFIFLV